MKRLPLSLLAGLLCLSGCMKIRDELLVMPDGSGRIMFTFSIPSKGEAGKFTETMLMSGDPDEITEKVRGLVAMTRPTLVEKDGVVQIRMTGYFDDLNALKFMDDGEGAKAKPKQEFVFRKDGEGTTVEMRGNLLSDEAPERGRKDPEFEKQKEDIFKAMFAGFEFRHDVKLPGTLTAAEGFGSREGRVATYAVGEKDLQKPADQKKINGATAFRATCAKSEVTEAEAEEFRKEIGHAKAGWADLRKEMKRNAEKK